MAEAWPPDYVAVFQSRQARLLKLRERPALWAGAKQHYRTRPVEWIEHWCVTYDPRRAAGGGMTTMPFILFQRQRDMVEFLMACLDGEESGLIEKCRDAGATWVCAAFSVWLWLFRPGASVGWGSRKEQLVDRLGDPDSIFEKMRMIVRNLPREFWPAGFSQVDHMSYMRFLNPETGATITGEAGDNIGRGGRKLIYFKDESAHYERPEKIEAALADNTRVQIDISSVNGLGNVFHRRREAGMEWKVGQPAHKGAANVFIMDWRDHPAKTQGWYEERRRKAESDGLMHVFAQEVDRSYAASVQGVIIHPDWVAAAIDAHIKLGFEPTGGWCAALDVADGGGDRNAFAARQGVVLRRLSEWGAPDTGVTARRAVEACEGLGEVPLQYDCIGVGAGVKAEANRLSEEGLMPKGVSLIPWNAAASPEDPEGYVIEGDDNSPRNKDFYANLKAQGWWNLARRFERTWRAVNEGVTYLPDDLISLPSDLDGLRQLQKELSQPTAGRTGAMKLMVNKTPEGTRSPNLGDAVMMAYWPVKGGFDPNTWLKAFA